MPMKVLAAFGAQLDEEAQQTENALADGYRLLALDLPAIGWALERRIDFLCFSDFVTDRERAVILEDAARRSASWFAPAGSGFVAEGVEWPTFDKEALLWFWWEVATAWAYLRAFEASGVQEVKLLPSDLTVGIYTEPTDVVLRIWSHPEATGIPVRAVAAGRGGGDRLSGSRWRPTRLLRSYTRRILHPRARKAVGIVLNPYEEFRMSAILSRFVQGRAGGVSAIFRECGAAFLSSARDRWEAEVLPEPLPPFVARREARIFTAALGRAREGTLEREASITLEALSEFFQGLATVRWPQLSSHLRAWKDFWSRSNATGLILSSLDDAENRIVAVGARSAGATVATVPHAEDLGYQNYTDVDLLLVGSSYQAAVYEQRGVAPSRILITPDAILEQEYPHSPASDEAGSGFRVLVLTAPLAQPGLAFPFISPSHQIDGLHALSDLHDPGAIEVRIKRHPGGADEGFVNGLQDVTPLCLPLGSRLHDELRDADVVVAFNYCGSALVHALRSRRPVILLWNDPTFGQLLPWKHASLFESGGALLRSLDDLRPLIQELSTDPGALTDLGRVAARFADRWLGRTGDPIDEIIRLRCGHREEGRK